MTLRRGNIVTIDFPQGQGLPPKRRPAVVVQCDRNNVRLTNAIFAMVSSNTRLAGSEPSQVFIDPSSPDGQLSGLLRGSVIKCENLYTLPQSNAVRTIGNLSSALLNELDQALKASLELS